jgi:FdhD protein
MPTRPRAVGLTRVTEWNDGKARRVDDFLAGEEPLEIRIGRHSLGITMRTPGHDEELVTGFLFTEGIIGAREQLLSFKQRNLRRGSTALPNNRALVRVGGGAKFNPKTAVRKFSAGSACGICGKESIAELRRRGIRMPESVTRFDPEILCGLPDKLRTEQAIFGRTGGLHAAGLFTPSGDLLALREDIGRHNAVDKVIGWALLAGKMPLGGHVLMVSGRGGFEITQKALAAGIPILASVSAPSSLAVQLARELGLTMVGFLRGRRFIVYSGAERLSLSASG